MVEPTQCRNAPGIGPVSFTLLAVTELRLPGATRDTRTVETRFEGTFSDCCRQMRITELPKGGSWSLVTTASLATTAL